MPSFTKPKVILLDIEGTTSSISFVHDVLFPYSAEKLPDFLRQNFHNPKVRAIYTAICREQGFPDEESSQLAVIKHLQNLIAQDIKDPFLKDLQGLIWRQGFEAGAFRSHMYPDVLAQLHNWTAAGIRLYIYSSGSVGAQQLFFKHTIDGNVLPLLSGHFDLAIGNKRESDSYQKIVTQLDLAPSAVLFLSDIREELVAAQVAGLQVCQIRRQAVTDSAAFPIFAADFSSIKLIP